MKFNDGTDREEVVVDCGGCTACCRAGMIVFLQPDDDPAKYKAHYMPAEQRETAVYENGVYVRTEPTKTGSAYYLGYPDMVCVHCADHGCDVHSDKPTACRAFSCVEWSLGLDHDGGVGDLTPERRAVYEAGIARR